MGKIAVIFGGTSGIGRATAELLAERGATVIVAGRHHSKWEQMQRELLQKLAEKQIKINPQQIIYAACDVRIEAQVQMLLADVYNRYHRVDFFFNNAGVLPINEGDITKIQLSNNQLEDTSLEYSFPGKIFPPASPQHFSSSFSSFSSPSSSLSSSSSSSSSLSSSSSSFSSPPSSSGELPEGKDVPLLQQQALLKKKLLQEKEPTVTQISDFHESSFLTVTVGLIYCLKWELTMIYTRQPPESAVSIVNTASGLGLNPSREHALYSASKAFVISYTKSAAAQAAEQVQKLKRAPIRINAIAPGKIDTPLYLNRLHSREQFDAEIRQTKLKRLGQPREVAELVAFLFSDNASYIDGDILAISGGGSATM